MSMLLRLDTPAVRRLIEDNPEFELELTRACVAEVAKQITTKHLPKVIEMVEPAAMAAALEAGRDNGWIRTEIGKVVAAMVERTGYYGSNYKPTAATQAMLNSAIQPMVSGYVDQVRAAANDAVSKAKQEAVDALATRLDVDGKIAEHVERRLNLRIQDEVDRRVKERLASALGLAT